MRRYQLTANFYLDEFTRSQTAARRGIDNSLSIDAKEVANLKALCETILQPVRDALGPVQITSGYRSATLNVAIGGSKRSQHVHGLAADIVVAGHTPLAVCRWIYANHTDYDQLSHEFAEWAHVSIAALGESPRRQPLTAYRDSGDTRYTPGIITVASKPGRAA